MAVKRMDRLETLKELKQMAKEDKFCRFWYRDSTGKRCAVGHILHRAGKSDAYLDGLCGAVGDLIEFDELSIQELPFTNDELESMQYWNDSNDGSALPAYLQGLINRENIERTENK